MALLIGSNTITGSGSTEKVDTWKIVDDIQQGRAKSVTLVDKDQLINVILTDDTKLSANYIAGQGTDLVDLLESEKTKGNLPDGYNVIVPKQSFLVSLLASVLPIILILGLLFYFMGQMQGGGKVMQFGKSKAKMITKDMPQTTFEIGRAHV